MSLENKIKNNSIKAVDFFCGGGGMSYGMKMSGVDVLAGIDYEENCKETYEANIGKNKFIQADVFDLKEKDLQDRLELKKNDDDLILIGCSPCQFWSIINTDKKKSEKSKNLLVEFERFVKFFNPGYVVVENVPGVLRRKEESGLDKFIEWLESKDAGYKVHFEVHNTNEYGVPQNRKRFTLIANRVSDSEIEPLKAEGKKPTVRDCIGLHNGFPILKAGNKDINNISNNVAGLKPICVERLKYVKKDGGNRFGFANNKKLQLKCFIGRESSFKDTFGRLWWDRPSSTITTKFYGISHGRFAHPEEDRALSIGEGAALQSFPKDFTFYGKSIASVARLIGNAVPPEYAKRIGLSIIKNHINAV
ncbi:MAG: DNA (cytosine-5-)-methyltransferase [Bacteroidales bacterium]|nr:DNA (cytosine-5-)-methyltransferase [Bacteroidales bacterium]